MSEERRWTASMLGAWQYAVSTIERGMTATAGYEDFLSGGGAIRTADWYYLCGKARESQATGDIVQGLPFETPIPSQAYTRVDVDYGQKYVGIIDVRYVDNVTGLRTRQTVYLAYDDTPTWRDMESDVVDLVSSKCPPTGGTEVEVLRSRFYSPMWLPP